MLNLVIINGYGGAGKDTFVNMCREYMLKNNLDIPVYNNHHSDLAKEALTLMGWAGNKDFASRDLLKKLTSYGDRTGINMWSITDTLTKLQLALKEDKRAIMFYHVREYAFIKNLTEWTTGMGINTMSMLIEREGKNEEPLCWYNIKKEDYDVVINNNGSLNDLYESAERFINTLLYGGEDDGEK